MAFEIYIRISDTEGREERLRSVEHQEAAAREWALRNDVEVAPGEPTTELDVSGAKAAEERALGKLIEKVERGEAEGIITSYLDRFGRDLISSAVALKRITDAGGRLVCVGDGFDSDSPGSELMFNLRMSIAQDYLNRVRANFLASQNGAAERGYYLAARAPFGYRRKDVIDPEYNSRGELVKDARLVIHEEEADLVQEVFKLRTDGANFGELLRFLESRRVRMSKSGIRGVLANRAYVGEMTVQTGRKGHPRTVTGNHDPILTESEWQAAQRKEVYRPRDGSIARQAKASGLVYCATCGSRLRVCAYGKPGERKATYVCTERDCSAHPAIATFKLDAYLEGLVQDAALAGNPYVAAVIEGSDAYDHALADVEAAQRDLAEFRDNIEMQRLLGMEGFAAGLATRNEALKLARAKLATLRPPQDVYAGKPGATFEEFMADHERDVLAQFIRRVVVKPAERREGRISKKLSDEERAARMRAAVEERVVEVLFVGEPEDANVETLVPRVAAVA